MTTETRASNRTTLDSQGRVLIPAHIRRARGWKPGERLVVEEVDGHLMVMTTREAGRLAQELFQRGRTDNRKTLADEVIAEHREAAARGD